MPPQISLLPSMIGSNTVASCSSSDSPDAGAQAAFSAASTGCMRAAYSAM
jgi:hypothetical protein